MKITYPAHQQGNDIKDEQTVETKDIVTLDIYVNDCSNLVSQEIALNEDGTLPDGIVELLEGMIAKAKRLNDF